MPGGAAVTAPICFVDTETTGLHPDDHEIWEVGLILPDGDEWSWMLPVDLGRADPYALKIGGFHDRHPQGDNNIQARPGHDDGAPLRGPWSQWSSEARWCPSLQVFAAEFCKLTADLHLVGAVVSFDEERLRRLARRNGACPDWHYHLIDVENLAVGYLSLVVHQLNLGFSDTGVWYNPTNDEYTLAELTELVTPPWESADLSRAVGVVPDLFDKHTALGDARWAKAIYQSVMGT